MNYSIRSYLPRLTVGVFAGILLFIFLSAGIALYLNLNREVDKGLEIEVKRLAGMVHTEFSGLISGETGLSDEFIEELTEIYLYKHQFVMIAMESDSGRHVYFGGEKENIQRLLADGFLSNNDGFYNRVQRQTLSHTYPAE